MFVNILGADIDVLDEKNALYLKYNYKFRSKIFVCTLRHIEMVYMTTQISKD